MYGLGKDLRLIEFEHETFVLMPYADKSSQPAKNIKVVTLMQSDLQFMEIRDGPVIQIGYSFDMEVIERNKMLIMITDSAVKKVAPELYRDYVLFREFCPYW